MEIISKISLTPTKYTSKSSTKTKTVLAIPQWLATSFHNLSKAKIKSNIKVTTLLRLAAAKIRPHKQITMIVKTNIHCNNKCLTLFFGKINHSSLIQINTNTVISNSFPLIHSTKLHNIISLNVIKPTNNITCLIKIRLIFSLNMKTFNFIILKNRTKPLLNK